MRLFLAISAEKLGLAEITLSQRVFAHLLLSGSLGDQVSIPQVVDIDVMGESAVVLVLLFIFRHDSNRT